MVFVKKKTGLSFLGS